ncbi:RAB6-interacting golgin isoform X2 [Patella vulgata]|nr:RAB6-interacting golgin isoform X2 [Patella vulgata]
MPNSNNNSRDRLFNNQQSPGINQALDPSQRLSHPKPQPVPENPTQKPSQNNKGKPNEERNQTMSEKNTDTDESKKKKEEETRELDESEVLNVELTTMENFQKQQKMIEEANKQKKALLSKTLDERRKKAKAESVKLTKIQKELNHLDHLLTADVSVIRDKIEMASLEYLDAQKRYDKAEKEVISAKMNLFEKGELKERLTEHLYTIIHQNEVRKAKKLAELMEILEMEISAEEMELQVTSIPTLTNFNSVHTLTSPTRKHSESEINHESPDGALKSVTTNTEQNTSPTGKEDNSPSNPDTQHVISKSSQSSSDQNKSNEEGTSPTNGSTSEQKPDHNIEKDKCNNNIDKTNSVVNGTDTSNTLAKITKSPILSQPIS